MPKKYKFIFILVVVFLAIGIVFLIFSGMSTPAGTDKNNNNTANLPDYILPTSEELKVKEFVKNFINLYNTYSYQDYTNLIALGDYQTAEMQKQTVDLVNTLESKIALGYAVETKTNIESFTYKYPKATSLNVEVSAEVSESQNYFPKGETEPAWQKSTVAVSLELVKYNQNWLVNNIKMVKK